MPFGELVYFFTVKIHDPEITQLKRTLVKKRVSLKELEHQARSPETNWAEFYANEFMEHCARSENPSEDKLALYYFDGCPFCNMVRANINKLGIDVELRNIFQDQKHRDDLVDARGRATVPVLRITSPDGEERWMPESRDIADYLQNTYG